MPDTSPAEWRLRPSADRRFRAGHPWVYSNELGKSPKGLPPGAPVELRDASGKFLARGYGNPASLISFRELSRDEKELEPWSGEAIERKLAAAARIREQSGLAGFSYRLCFGEADGLPGLIVDRYEVAQGTVFVTQAHTAGIQRLQGLVGEALARLWPGSGWVVRNDLGVRKLEGLEEEPSRVERLPRGNPGARLQDARIQVSPGIEFSVDLIEGQKTGFFLDQAGNIRQALQHLLPFARDLYSREKRALRILDLCCYVGQWSAQFASALQKAGIPCEFLLVDASQSALDRAKTNVTPFGAPVDILKADVLHGLDGIHSGSFDVVISDPPALIKGRKDIPQGRHAYLQLHTQVFRIARPGALTVCCSCSALLEEEEFLGTLAKASARNRRRVRWTSRGTQASDHPALAEFPEGRYLKCWIGIAD